MAEEIAYLIDGGYCLTQKGLMDGSSITERGEVHSMYGYFTHNGHHCLFDTGYSEEFEELNYPEKMYHWITQFPKGQFLEQNLPFDPEEIEYVFISHFHADHIAGLKKYPRAKFVAMGKPQKSLLDGYISKLFPVDFEERLLVVGETKTKKDEDGEDEINDKTQVDFFEDGAVILISLPGHAEGHMGLMLRKQIFFVGDAVWSSKNYREAKMPSRLTRWVHHDYDDYQKSVQVLRRLALENPEMLILPAHCPEKFSKYFADQERIAVPLHQEINERKKLLAGFKPIVDSSSLLITGGTGFIGGRVAQILAESGYQVTIVGRNRTKAIEVCRDYPEIQFVACDLREEKAVAQIFEKRQFDAVIHAAARCQPWGRWEDFYLDNVEATRLLLQQSQVHKVGLFVQISSPSIYFGNRTGHHQGVGEDYIPESDQSHYNKSKMMAENLVRRQDRIPFVVLRPRGVFGPGDQTIMPRILKRLQNRRLPIIGTGNNLADLTYVDNVAKAVLLSLTTPTAWGRPYNITNHEPIQIWRLISRIAETLKQPRILFRIPFVLLWFLAFFMEMIAKILNFFWIPVTPPITRYLVNLLGRTCTLDNSMAIKYLNYYPQISMEEGFKRTMDALQDRTEHAQKTL